MGLFNVLGSLQNIESAEAAGDPYETRRSLTINGFGSVAAALFGSAFPTTIYIGHPGLEGARRARRLLDPERRVRHGDLPDRHARVDRVGDSDRRGDGDRAVDRDDDRRAGVRRDPARAHARGRRRAAARHRRVGRAAGEERPARRRPRRPGRPVQRGADRRVPEERHVDRRRLRARAGLPVHRDAAVGGGGRRDRAPLERRRRVVPLRRGRCPRPG